MFPWLMVQNGGGKFLSLTLLLPHQPVCPLLSSLLHQLPQTLSLMFGSTNISALPSALLTFHTVPNVVAPIRFKNWTHLRIIAQGAF